jgi:hypothetical protein
MPTNIKSRIDKICGLEIELKIKELNKNVA